jgi:hypothetical protein
MEIISTAVSPPGGAKNQYVPSSIYVFGAGCRQDRAISVEVRPRKAIDAIDLTGLPHVRLDAGKAARRCSNALSG